MAKHSQHTKQVKDLIKILNGGYEYESRSMLEAFVEHALSVWKAPGVDRPQPSLRSRMQEAFECYGELIMTHEPFEDILGPVFMEVVSGKSRDVKGQFFTPWSICKMMAMMTIGTDPIKSLDRMTTIIDPACGSGATLLAAANQILTTQGNQALYMTSFSAIDIDLLCARLTAVQMVANCNVLGVQLGEIVVYHGNTLGPLTDMRTVLHANAPGHVVPPALDPIRQRMIQNSLGHRPVQAQPRVRDTRHSAEKQVLVTID